MAGILPLHHVRALLLLLLVPLLRCVDGVGERFVGVAVAWEVALLHRHL